ncbi:hypothetical protein pb186bvf_003422 [Paramecium bursaria]
MLEGHEMLGVFAYFGLRFNQDKLLMQTIQQFECKYDGYDKHLEELREKDYVYQSDLFTLKNYSEYSHDIVEYNEELSLAKIQYVKNRIHHQSVEQYYNIIFIRSVCAQQISRSIYPWVAFEVLIKDKVYLISMDFLEHYYSEISNGRQKRCTHFAQLEKVTYGFGFDEIIITKNNKAIVYKARYQEQRMFIAEIFRFAMSKDMELKLKNHFINPNDGNFKEQLNQQIDNMRMAQQNYFTLILDDLIIPPPLILCYKGNMQIQSYNNYICLGVNNIICYDTKIITSVIPYMGESFHIEIFEDPRCLGLHVGKQFNYAYFETKRESENFRIAILARRKNQFTLEPIYIHFTNSQNQQSYSNFKKKKVQQLDELIQQTEHKLDKYLDLKDQLDMSFVAEELKTAIKKSQVQKISPIQSTIFDFDPTKSLSFQRQLNE